jgi:hypothetical protein
MHSFFKDKKCVYLICSHCVTEKNYIATDLPEQLTNFVINNNQYILSESTIVLILFLKFNPYNYCWFYI